MQVRKAKPLYGAEEGLADRRGGALHRKVIRKKPYLQLSLRNECQMYANQHLL